MENVINQKIKERLVMISKNEIHKYASDYSHKLWNKIMKHWRDNKDYHIGANDVSDFVMNAIIDALNDMSYENLDKYFPEKCGTVDEHCDSQYGNVFYEFEYKDYICRNADGTLHAFTCENGKKPFRVKAFGKEFWANGRIHNDYLCGTEIGDKSGKFDYITWETEPVQTTPEIYNLL